MTYKVATFSDDRPQAPTKVFAKGALVGHIKKKNADHFDAYTAEGRSRIHLGTFESRTHAYNAVLEATGHSDLTVKTAATDPR